MQIESTNSDYNISTTKETNTTNSVEPTEKKFDMTQPFDIESFTYEDYKAINGDDLRDWIRDSNLPRETEVKIGALHGMTSYSDDDILNEVLFDKLNDTYNRGEDFGDFIKAVLLPIADMHAQIDKPIDYENSLMNPEVAEAFKKDPKNWSYSLSGGERRTLDYSFKSEDLFHYMNSYPEFHKRVEESYPSFYKSVNFTAVTQSFSEIMTEYTKRKDEQNATLEAYTRNTKQNPIVS